jgi:hypothetical protein
VLCKCSVEQITKNPLISKKRGLFFMQIIVLGVIFKGNKKQDFLNSVGERASARSPTLASTLVAERNRSTLTNQSRSIEP